MSLPIDITRLKKLASGFTADVFILDESKVVKVFFESMTDELIENEYNVNKLIQSYGINLPKVYELVDCGTRKGIVFQRLRNYTLRNKIDSDTKQYNACAKILAREHAKVNAISDIRRGLPDQKREYVRFIKSRTSINEHSKNILINQINSLPDNDKICHGDFHPINLLLDNDSIFIIDWLGATRGDPVADVAGSYLIITIMGAALRKMPFFKKKLLSIFVRKFADAYKKEYMRITGVSMRDIEKWIPVRAATYLDVGLPDQINQQLLKLINDFVKRTT